jgi:hypothetical protein
MKINPKFETLQYPLRVREKTDSPSNQQKQNSDPEREPQGSPENPEEFNGEDLHPERLGKALESFKVDQQAQSNGLEAKIEGTGPGLKVVLKDSAGGVIRQFTGQEFVQLREISSKGGQTRGKILDRKL